MAYRIKIKITKEVLEASKMCGFDAKTLCRISADEANVGTNCAIGKAVSSLLPTAWVSLYTIYIYNQEPTHKHISLANALDEIHMPPKATDFIHLFDKTPPSGRPAMTPIEFKIDVPDSVINRIGIKEVDRILENSETMEKIKV